MGKPSSSIQSKMSRSSSNMDVPLKQSKTIVMKKKGRQRTQRNINKLFAQMKSEAGILDNLSHSSLSISLDNTLDSTETQTNVSNGKSIKRKLSPDLNGNTNKKRKSNSVIVINDDDSSTDESPRSYTPKKQCSTIQCSTPIIKKDSKTLTELLVNTFPKNNNSNTIPNLNENVINLTKEINPDSYFTIDLTDSDSRKSNKMVDSTTVHNLDQTEESQNTVIDLINVTDGQDCSIISVIQPDPSESPENSLSGESDVTVLRNKENKNTKHLRKIAQGIAELNASEKGHILEYITQKIFNGCNMSNNVKRSLTYITETVSNREGNAENEYIKQMIINKSSSNSVGSNIYHPERGSKNKTGLRMIAIDGSNVAMEYGKGKVFSVEGLKICIDYFIKRGHRVKAFVPRFRCKFGKSSNPRLLDALQREGSVVYTPSREVKGRMITPYDDRYIIQCAAEFDGVIVSGDNYRDLLHENAKWRFVIENRLLPFTWVDNMIMFPRDPLGRNGPTLEQFLRHPSQ